MWLGKYAQITVCSLGNGLKLAFPNSILWLGIRALRLNATWHSIPRILWLMNSPNVIKATYVTDFGTESCINCSHRVSSLEVTIWDLYLFSSRSHQMLMRWVPTLHCWSPVEVMQHSPGDGDQVPHLRAGLGTLMVCDCSSFIGWCSCHPYIAFENLVGVCLWIWEPHFQISYVELLI